MTLRFPLALVTLSLLVIGLPFFTHAQQEDLRATIMAQVLQDPRSAEIPPAQLEQIIDALSQKAQSENLESADIVWQPGAFHEAAASVESVPACDSLIPLACVFTEAFGFQGEAVVIPLYLLVASGLLILLIRRMHHHHAAEAARAASAQ
ncbi:MAG: hypothetical protein RLZZ342_189 [Candidatus Parcubacteria bacterium]|jgi:hypothetical protein